MKRTRNIFILTSVLILGFSVYVNIRSNSKGFKIQIGQNAPDFIFNNEMEYNRLSDLKGNVVLLQFTASWCGVCRKEMPFLEKEIWQKYRNDSFILVGIARGETIDKSKKFKKLIGITYPIISDKNSEIFNLYSLPKSGVTRNVLIGKDGRIIFTTEGFNDKTIKNLDNKIKTGLNKSFF